MNRPRPYSGFSGRSRGGGSAAGPEARGRVRGGRGGPAARRAACTGSGSASAGAAVRRDGAVGHLEQADQAVGLAVELLHLAQAGAARGAAADVGLYLLHLVQVQLAVEQGVQSAFVKMRHGSLVPARDTLRPVAAGLAPA